MKNQILETIRKEIISRIDKRHLSAQAKNELVSILSFLSDLEKECEEKPKKGLHHGSLRKVDNPMKWMEDDAKELTLAEGLEEEMDKFFETMPVLEHENIFEDTFKNIARHFYELGQQSKPKVCEELEEEIYNYANTIAEGTPLFEIIPQTARHFAKWGAEHRGSSETPKDLEEAAEEYASNEMMSGLAERAFKAGAGWQREKSEKSTPAEGLEKAARLYAIPWFIKDIDESYLDEYPYDRGVEIAFIAGAKWDREQMQKEAVEGVVVSELGAVSLPRYVYEKYDGQKVRIIIVKED